MRILPILIILSLFHVELYGQKLFTALSPQQSKINFNNAIQDTKEHNIMIYSNFYGGAGVGLGDINNDGLLDIYFAGNQVGDKLYLNKGNLVFEDITRKAGIKDKGGWSSGVLFGDVNKDGFVDIYVTKELYDDAPELRRNKLYINQGDNTFEESAADYGADDDQRTRHATFLDYDKDGDLDLFLLNQPPNPGDYSKYYNTELLVEKYAVKLLELQDQKYVDVTEKAGLKKTGFPNSVVASDLNNDGWTDLYVANDFWVGDWYFLNNGDGTFSEKVHDNLRHTSFSSMGVDAGDINKDGRQDMIVVDMVAEDNYRLKANMSGMNPKSFWKVVADGGHYQYMFNMLQLNVGEGQFSDIAQLANVASTDWSWSALFADLDNDSWQDLYITNGLMRDIRNNDAAKETKALIESTVFEYLQENPDPKGEVSIWDIVDIEEALSLTPSEKLSNYVFKNNGDLTFSKKMSDWGLDQETFSNGAAYGDLDNDGDLDLVVNNVNDIALIYQNHSTEKQMGNYLRVAPIADDSKIALLGTKISIETAEGNQYQEIISVRGMYSTSEHIAHFGLGKLDKVEKVSVLWPDGKETILKNVKANQQLEISYRKEKKKAKAEKDILREKMLNNITSSSELDFSHQENEFDDYLMQVLLPHKMSTMGPALAVGDINGDNLDDFFVGGAVKEPGQIYIQQADGKFRAVENEIFVQDKVHEDVGATFFDLEGDGDLDLYVVSGGNEFNPNSKSYHDRLYINNGKGQFTTGRHLMPEHKISGSKAYPCDFDQDGDQDLFVAGRHVPWSYPEAASSLLLENIDGRLEDVTNTKATVLNEIGMINDAVWMDYDQDGWQDLILVGEWMPVTVLKNQSGTLEKVDQTGMEEHTGWWFSIAAADMDLDGDQDIIAGNLGLNYKYKASKEEPFEVYHYDFDENGKKDIVLTYYNFGEKYPLRGRQCSSEQVPMLKEQFETYDIFASSNVLQIYGQDNLENALHLEATNFASTYYENLGNGQFKAHRLPVEAQFSSVNDLIIKDLNGDQYPDILLAGNLYDAEVETARNDAGFGLLLLNEKEGRFKAIDRMESGFFLPHNVKNLGLINGSERQLILAICNNAAAQIFEIKAKEKIKN